MSCSLSVATEACFRDPRVCESAPRKTKSALSGAQEDQGRVGRQPEGLRARWVAPRRTKVARGGVESPLAVLRPFVVLSRIN